MKVAEVLSDLVSLRVCDHTAAMNLVSADSLLTSTGKLDPENSHPDINSKPALSRSLSGLADSEAGSSPDLQRALDLVDLHYGVKEKYVQDGGNQALQHAREEVERVLKTVK